MGPNAKLPMTSTATRKEAPYKLQRRIFFQDLGRILGPERPPSGFRPESRLRFGECRLRLLLFRLLLSGNFPTSVQLPYVDPDYPASGANVSRGYSPIQVRLNKLDYSVLVEAIKRL